MRDPTKQVVVAFTIASIISGAIGWLFMTFATVAYVDAKYSPIEERLRIIDERTWEMNGRRDPQPLGIKHKPKGNAWTQ